MKILVAPDSMKESLSASRAATAIRRGVERVLPEASFDLAPLADGGEGTLEALVLATNGEILRRKTVDPLGREIEASIGVLGGRKTAVIEVAQASGLALLAREDRRPDLASTFGTGRLLVAALEEGFRSFVFALGSSATNDAGTGILRALGARFLDGAGKELEPGGAALARLERIDLAALDLRLAECELMIACDVTNPLTGPEGASRIYGPQKGATPLMCADLDAALARFEHLCSAQHGREIGRFPGSGAAGGIAAGLSLVASPLIRSGFDLVAEAIDLPARIACCDVAFTAEGRLDGQSVRGKTPSGVARLAARQGVPLVALAGELQSGFEPLYDAGLSAALPIAPGPVTLQACLDNVEALLADAAERAARLIRLGGGLTKCFSLSQPRG